MEYNSYYTDFYTKAFDKIKVFDSFSFEEIEKMFLNVQKELLESNDWNITGDITPTNYSRKILLNSDGSPKLFFNKGSLSKKYKNSYLNIKPCITGKTIGKEQYETNRYILLSIPKEIINNYQTGSINSSNLDIIREFVRDVELTCGWKGDWKKVEKIYDIRCGSDEWRKDFSHEWYLSLVEDGVIFPPFYIDKQFLSRGTHRSYLGALAGYDFLFFLEQPSNKFSTYTHNNSSGREYWMNDKLLLDVDVDNKTIEYKFKNSGKLIGKLKL